MDIHTPADASKSYSSRVEEESISPQRQRSIFISHGMESFVVIFFCSILSGESLGAVNYCVCFQTRLKSPERPEGVILTSERAQYSAKH